MINDRIASAAMRLTEQEYHSRSELSRHQLDWIRKSPAHFKWNTHHPGKDTPAFQLGRAVHAACLQPHVFVKDFISYPGAVRRGKEWEQFQADHSGKQIITQTDMNQVTQMAESFHSRPVASTLAKAGLVEPSFFWCNPTCGVQCRGRPDAIFGSTIYDLKTTQDAAADSFLRDARKFGYHRQAAWYIDGIEMASGYRPSGFTFVCLEKFPPYAVALYALPEELIEIGRKECAEMLRIYRTALELNEWPSYPDYVQTLTPPIWWQYEGEAHHE